MENANEQVVLVDDNDQSINLMDKLEAHRKGLLHRAISLWIEDGNGRVLLQQRASSKYHSPNLWSNACCSHPRDGEPLQKAASRRLQEELGILCPLREVTSFIYKAPVGHGLVEHEFDHLFFGQYSGDVPFNSNEVSAIQWIDRTWLKASLAQQPDMFTSWFPYVYENIELLDRS